MITKFTGDEGRDRLANPSINAPHTPEEAWNAILLSAILHLTGQRNSIASTEDTMFGPGRSADQAAWLTQSNERLIRHLAGQKVVS